ncbi:MAG: hypothetical protein Q8N63_04585 [Nanoarchaeota archaeon]|nr:hypothetical protein [Nanoarchaeota archaeon]
MKSKTAQGWGMDLIIAVSIFTIGLVAFYIYSLNSPGEAKENLESLSYDGRILANTILSEGSPTGWDKTSVAKIGILTNNKINETKLQYFYELTNTSAGYNNTKQKFDINYDYYFYLNESMNINGNPVPGIGKPGFDREDIPEDVKNLVKITRYTIYKNKPMTAYFYIWEE